MLSSKKRMLWVFIVILLLGIAVVSYGYFLVSCDHNSYIKRGFSTELKDKLKEQYGLNIPDDAVFIQGYYDNAFRDPTVNIIFKIPKDKLNVLFSSNWVLYNSIETQRPDKSYVSGMWHKEVQWTNIYFKEEVDGYIEAFFMGGNPGNPIK